MRQNICPLWSLICYPSDNDVMVIVRLTLLYSIAIAFLPVFVFSYLIDCYHVFLMNKDIGIVTAGFEGAYRLAVDCGPRRMSRRSSTSSVSPSPPAAAAKPSPPASSFSEQHSRAISVAHRTQLHTDSSDGHPCCRPRTRGLLAISSLTGQTGPPGTCQVGQLVRRPGGPSCQMLKGVWTFRTTDYSYHGLFVPHVDHSYHGPFVP